MIPRSAKEVAWIVAPRYSQSGRVLSESTNQTRLHHRSFQSTTVVEECPWFELLKDENDCNAAGRVFTDRDSRCHHRANSKLTTKLLGNFRGHLTWKYCPNGFPLLLLLRSTRSISCRPQYAHKKHKDPITGDSERIGQQQQQLLSLSPNQQKCPH